MENLKRNNKKINRNQQEIKDIEFEILGNIEECNIADKFNVYYIYKKLPFLKKKVIFYRYHFFFLVIHKLIRFC